MNRVERPIRIWVLSDGRLGNENQALGLAEAIARVRAASIEVKRVGIGTGAARLPAWAAHGLGRILPGWPEATIAEGRERLSPPWPDIAIGAGRRVAPIVAALRRRRRAFAVQILDPQMPTRAFDLVVAPRHDGLRGARVVETVGSIGRVTPASVAQAAREIAPMVEPYPEPRVAVMIGGRSRSARFDEAARRQLISSLQILADRRSLLVTLSGRSHHHLISGVTWAVGARGFVWTGATPGAEGVSGPNPYPGMLGHAEAALVTADSVNMASEAASAGLPVHVYPLEGLSRKLERFHESLAEHGASRPFDGRIERWRYPPLEEADRVAGRVLARMEA